MINTCFILGYPAEFKNLCLIYPPKVKDVVANKNYSIYMRILTFSQEEIEDEYAKANLDMKDLLTPFEYILNNAYNNKQFKVLLEQAFLFFIHEPITCLYETKQILIGDLKENTSGEWWSLSPTRWGSSNPYVWIVSGSDYPGNLGSISVINSRGVRPAISLKTCTLWTSGNGAPETPYEISTTPSAPPCRPGASPPCWRGRT